MLHPAVCLTSWWAFAAILRQDNTLVGYTGRLELDRMAAWDSLDLDPDPEWPPGTRSIQILLFN